MTLKDLNEAFVIDAAAYEALPDHVAAFCRYLIPRDRDGLDGHASLPDGSWNYQKIAAAGYALAGGSSQDGCVAAFKDAVTRLSGRTFFAVGRTPRFEVDGVALIGVALGAKAAGILKEDRGWLDSLLRRSSRTLQADEWQRDLVEVARCIINPDHEVSIKDVRLRTTFSRITTQEERQAAWAKVVASGGDGDAVQIAVNRAVFEQCATSLAALSLDGAAVEGLIAILEGLAQSMAHWTYETKPRVKGVTPQQWEVDHEYHVQNLLWTVLRPVFSELVDEQSLPKVGHKTPRYDLGVPSLGTIVEVKFMRKAGSTACREIIEEIAADRSLYLAPNSGYSRLVVFIWDECRQTEEYQTLSEGLESLDGIEKIVILPRPARMER